MQWYHECDIDWLRARQRCLTATDIKDLLPITKTGRPRKVTDENYLKVFASKLCHISPDAAKSTGAAARGHILEPYAIEMFNKVGPKLGFPQLCHWDDLIVTRQLHSPYCLAFSPDAMNVSMQDMVKEGKVVKATDDIKVIGEIKSYSPERHTVCGYTPKSDLEERWQVASAMAVCESIETAYLIFFNPSMQNQMYVVDYFREDLEDEIEMILKVEEDWLAWTTELSDLNCHVLFDGDLLAEEQLIKEIIKKEELNPSGKKSVIV